MKKPLFSSLVAVTISAASFGQTKPSQTIKISTPTVQCDMCKNRIEEYLRRVDGVTFVNVAVKKKETTVKYSADRTNDEMIKTSIANAGFDAAEIKANSESYKALPKCCKKPEDGGGMPKH